jgi:hypothetical protein
LLAFLFVVIAKVHEDGGFNGIHGPVSPLESALMLHPVSIDCKGLIISLESALTRRVRPKLFRINTYRKTGEGWVAQASACGLTLALQGESHRLKSVLQRLSAAP